MISLLGNLSWLLLSSQTLAKVRTVVDVVLVLTLTYAILRVVAERRTLWMIRGFIFLLLATSLSRAIELQFLSFVLHNLVIGSAVALAVILQSEIRIFLEQLGRGQFFGFMQPVAESSLTNDAVDLIVTAVKGLSQDRTGALILLETHTKLSPQDFTHAGIALNARLSPELITSIFQVSSPLHDGAIWVRGAEVIAAKLILPLSDRTGPWQLGTRHRAALGITERISHCVCVVVSEETGSISLAFKGELQRPLTSSKLGELLRQYVQDQGTATSQPRQRRHSLKFWKTVWPLR
ncbi:MULTISPECIES: diadenylate cyclase CdaA [unclassified Thermosynechococcus]|uniref:diadenylate cyclase CdaA n=1 Tax=unclassified Thermosynechococcus TaxID=2622553 RepID=UPI00197F6B18|nr:MULTISPECIES: diadenylate cyclase CdaA [unclassified Thermosynechococcus]MDR5640006.1 diadenylate cyclase CdaA [Thermosynechococcus sp. PP42]MDR7897565.1 diadenylate cyclase CdaA [Thermosynechococcus sp. JY1332]MDR7904970.1 diadenylate cyclase CdaA [Thermosynechococcus sp. JY1334]MDR7992796.1 diadenylate cyclase CdaA [Thermosynechococcus sp. TG252]QSF48921.1 diadenylate cyclase CdaA [Thermosynechococcus sp. TA-1]